MYSKEEKVVMWLSSFDFMTYKKAKLFVDNFVSLCDVFDNLSKYRNDLLKMFSDKEYNCLIEDNNLVYIDRVIENYKKLGVEVVTIKSDLYPELLKETSSPPIIIA